MHKVFIFTSDQFNWSGVLKRMPTSSQLEVIKLLKSILFLSNVAPFFRMWQQQSVHHSFFLFVRCCFFLFSELHSFSLFVVNGFDANTVWLYMHLPYAICSSPHISHPLLIRWMRSNFHWHKQILQKVIFSIRRPI